VGLLLGNLLAVLSWTLVCAPIAVRTRLTLYWYLRKIAGPAVMVIYNVLNAVLYCILAGAMITVAASAVRIPFGIPEQTGWYPTDFRFVLVVLGVGAVVVTLAIWGFKRLAQFASVCSPWMFLMFIAGALVVLPTIGHVGSFAGFWKLANERIWTGTTPDGGAGLGFWHVVFFAWICNLAMHLGLSDMAVFRYARRSAYGLYSAFGMYLGHYLAWICAGIMGAAAVGLVGKPLGDIDSGAVAFAALGGMGALAVIIAGWTTSNPTLYRAGLALQVVTPGWPRWMVTLVAGAITTIIACSPFVFTKLLGFVAIYGIMLVPVGAIVVTEHWIFPRIGLTRFWSARKKQVLNWPALVSWLVGLGFAATVWGVKLYTTWQVQQGLREEPVEILHEFFLVIPVWLMTTVLYIVLAALAGARKPLPELEEETAAPPATEEPAKEPGAVSGFDKRLFFFSGLLALFCLALILALSWCVFVGYLRPEVFKHHLIFLTLVYFVSGVIWIRQREKRRTAAAAQAHTAGSAETAEA
jgi:NCS1 family nucleobase:cation symporter-1